MMITCKSLQVLDDTSLIGRWLHTFHFIWAIKKKSVHRHLVVNVHLKLFLYVWDFTHIYLYIHFNFCLLCMPVTAFDTVKFHFWGSPHQQHWHWTRYPHLDNPLCILYCICILPPGAVLPLRGVSESLVTWEHMIEHISVGRMEFHLPK